MSRAALRIGLGFLVMNMATGCSLTPWRLRRTVVTQASTLTELQYQQVLGNLAMMSLDPDAIPSHVNIRDGSAQVQDNGVLSSSSNSTIYPSLSGSRTLVAQWSMIPVTDDVELRILRLAYRRALGYEEELELDLANDLAHSLCDRVSNSDYLDLRSDPNVNVSVLNAAHLFDGLAKPDSREANLPHLLKANRDAYYLGTTEIFEPTLLRFNNIANAFGQLAIVSNDDKLVFGDELKPPPGSAKPTADLIKEMDISTYVRTEKNGRDYPASASPVVREARRQVKEFYGDLLEIRGGWFGVGSKHEVPHDASYVGKFKHQYAWVCPRGRKELADFTIKILNFATLIKDETITTVPGGPRFTPSVPSR
jgi:hypothetical protein